MMNIKEDTNCLPISIILGGLEPSPLSPETVEKSKPLPIAISAPTPIECIDRTSQMLPSMEISETITHAEELTFSQAVFHAQTQVSRETKKDLMEMSPNSGLSTYDALEKVSQDSSLSKTQRDYSIAEWEKSFKAYPKAGTFANGRLSPLEPLAVPKLESGCSSLPTMTTGLGAGRNAGATKCEKYLKDKGFVQSIQALSVEMMSLIFGFPKDWVLCLLASPKESKAETKLEPCLGEQLTLIAPPLQSSESSTLIAFSANSIDASLDSLLDRVNQLIASGASPEGVWLSCSQVRDREFYQVQWRSGAAHPWLGGQKSKYVGILDSDEHKSAIAIHRAGQELVKVQKQIKKLQEKS